MICCNSQFIIFKDIYYSSFCIIKKMLNCRTNHIAPGVYIMYNTSEGGGLLEKNMKNESFFGVGNNKMGN